MPLVMKENIYIKHLFIHSYKILFADPTETHLVFLSNPRENTHTVPDTSASTTNTYNMENNQKSKIISYKYRMFAHKMSKLVI